MKLDLYASQTHYLDHAAAVWHALSEDARGTVYVAQQRDLALHARTLGLAPRYGVPPRNSRRHVMVASGNDLKAAGHGCILLEHGAGQTYAGVTHPSWAGGDGRDRVVLFVVPNERVAWANAARYPDAHHVICAPRLEQLARIAADEHTPDLAVVASRHWDSAFCPELASAWPHYHHALRTVVNGLHAHPRRAHAQATIARDFGVPYLPTFEEVVRRSHAYVVDNSSTGFEWAALGRPVVWLNAPNYRRNVEHGLRFWSHVGVGLQVDRPEDLMRVVRAALGGEYDRARQRVLTHDVFPVVEGSAKLAATAIEELL